MINMKSLKTLGRRRPALNQRLRALVEPLEARMLYSADLTALGLAVNSALEQTAQSVYAVIASTSTALAALHQVVVVDSRISDFSTLLKGLASEQINAINSGNKFDILVLSPLDDGITKITNFLSSQSDVTSLHLVSHGQDGMLLLGNQWLDATTLRSRSMDFSAWGNALTSDADVFLYGCDFAASEAGKNTVKALAQLTNADVAASTDITSNDPTRGNWRLEFRTGEVNDQSSSTIARAANGWASALATFVVTNTNDSGAGSLRQAIGDANSNAGADLISFNIAAPLVNGAHSISLLSALPELTEIVTIDGDTQADAVMLGRPTIELVGNGTSFVGLKVKGNGSVISGLVIANFSDGIVVAGDNITIRHNVIGLTADGSSASGNAYSGILVTGRNAVIGGTSVDRNIISGNLSDGIQVQGDAASILGNYFGLGLDGIATFGNGSSGFGSGIYIDSSRDARVGSSNPQEANFIANSTENGIWIRGAGSTNNLIFGNVIGQTTAGTAAGNGSEGILIESGAKNNLVGGINFGQTNVIANSGRLRIASGVYVSTTASTGNSISGNSIFASNGLGIDIGSPGITTAGLPLLALASNNGTTTTILGSFSGTANTQYQIEYFSNDPATGLDPTGYGEGQTYLFAIYATTDAAGNANFSTSLPFTVPVGFRIAATATSFATGNTTEFSDTVIVVSNTLSVSAPTGLTVSESGTSANFSARLQSQPSADVVIPVSLSDSTEGQLSTATLTFTTANWNVTQTITLTGKPDGLVDGAIGYSVILGNATSADPLFNGLLGKVLLAGTTDIDTYNSIVVDTTADLSDGDTSSLANLLANRGSDGAISLREAIIASNNTGNALGSPDRISFALPGATSLGMHVITLSSDLPLITDSVVINGATDPLYIASPVVRIDGAGIYKGLNLSVGSGGSTLNALSITGMLGSGISINSGNNIVTSSYIGNTGLAAAGNTSEGIAIYSANNVIGLTGGGNVISGNANTNVIISGSNAKNNQVSGNFIGTNNTGTASLNNGQSGVALIDSGAGNIIGGTTPQTRNIISGNNWYGVELFGATHHAIVQGNFIGTDDSGIRAIGNLQGGIAVWNGGNFSTIGGTSNTQGNVISGNSRNGIQIDGSTATPDQITIQSNYIGVDATGLSALGNGLAGIQITRGSNVQIGGSNLGGGNVISGNNTSGIELSGSANLTRITGNIIGLDAFGRTALGLGNGQDGVTVFGTNTIIGGRKGIEGNYISGQTNVASLSDGIYAIGAVGLTIQGNYLGLAADGVSPAGNYHTGIMIDSSSMILIGGTSAPLANIIANNGSGVGVANASFDVAILGNEIYNNIKLGIDLSPTVFSDGVTANDLSDADAGPNGYQNFPVIESTTLDAGDLAITGSFNSTPNTSYRIEFFANQAGFGDATNHGQAHAFVGSTEISTDAFGNATYSVSFLGAPVLVNSTISATATVSKGAGNFGASSEFSSNSQVTAKQAPAIPTFTNPTVITPTPGPTPVPTTAADANGSTLKTIEAPPFVQPLATARANSSSAISSTAIASFINTGLINFLNESGDIGTALARAIADHSEFSASHEEASTRRQSDQTNWPSAGRYTSTAINAIVEPLRSAINKAVTVKGIRSGDLYAAGVAQSFVKQLQMAKENKQALELMLFNADGQAILQQRLDNNSFSQLLASWETKYSELSGAKLDVLLVNFEMPNSTSVGSVNLPDIDQSIKQRRSEALISGLEIGGVVISVGLVSWATRAGALITAVITALPAWKAFDPLLLLAPNKVERTIVQHDFSDTDIQIDEEAVAGVLS
jgi:Domain of unknown function (DUF4347)